MNRICTHSLGREQEQRGPDEKGQPGKYLGDAHSMKRECSVKSNELRRSLAGSGVETEAKYGGSITDEVKVNEWPEWNRFCLLGCQTGLLSSSPFRVHISE